MFFFYYEKFDSLFDDEETVLIANFSNKPMYIQNIYNSKKLS